MSTQKLTVKCPQCNRRIEWIQENSYRPFCSERCKLIDLGEWASEEKRIPGEPAFPEIESDETYFQ